MCSMLGLFSWYDTRYNGQHSRSVEIHSLHSEGFSSCFCACWPLKDGPVTEGRYLLKLLVLAKSAAQRMEKFGISMAG